MRICLLTPAFPPELGGQEAHALELAECLTVQGASVQVLTRRALPDCPREERLRGVPVVRLEPTGELKGRGWRGIVPLLRFMAATFWFLLRRPRSYDVVLVSGFNILPLVAVTACALTRTRCVVRPESPLELSEVIGKESLARMGLSQRSVFYRAIEGARRALARRVDRYAAISAEIARGLVRVGIDPQRIVAIPNGIDAARFAPVEADRRLALRARLGLPPTGRVVTYTGRLVVSKGVMMLAEIWALLAPEYPDAHLVLAGSGAGSVDACDAELAASLAAAGLGGRVTLPGNVANVEEWLQASDVFVFPSEAEGFGLSILEAMAVGLPMVTTRVGVVAELANAEQRAMVVAPHARDEFAAALRRLLDDPELCRRLGQRARSDVRQEYGMESVARRYLQLFAEIT